MSIKIVPATLHSKLSVTSVLATVLTFAVCSDNMNVRLCQSGHACAETNLGGQRSGYSSEPWKESYRFKVGESHCMFPPMAFPDESWSVYTPYTVFQCLSAKFLLPFTVNT